jgi:hypothetical protein
MFTFRSNVVADWLTILLSIREVPGTNLGPEIGYPEVFCDLTQSFQENVRIVL